MRGHPQPEELSPIPAESHLQCRNRTDEAARPTTGRPGGEVRLRTGLAVDQLRRMSGMIAGSAPFAGVAALSLFRHVGG
jgi:hypothetical protein